MGFLAGAVTGGSGGLSNEQSEAIEFGEFGGGGAQFGPVNVGSGRQAAGAAVNWPLVIAGGVAGLLVLVYLIRK